MVKRFKYHDMNVRINLFKKNTTVITVIYKSCQNLNSIRIHICIAVRLYNGPNWLIVFYKITLHIIDFRFKTIEKACPNEFELLLKHDILTLLWKLVDTWC